MRWHLHSTLKGEMGKACGRGILSECPQPPSRENPGVWSWIDLGLVPDSPTPATKAEWPWTSVSAFVPLGEAGALCLAASADSRARVSPKSD